MVSEKPARFRAGFSFGNRANGLRHVAQVIELRGNGALQRLSERLLHSPTSSVAAAARPVQILGIALRSAMYLLTLSEGSRICMQRQLTFGGCSYSFVNWEMLSVRPNRGMLTPSH